MTITSILQNYARTIRQLRRANPDVPEPALAPAFQRLLDEAMALLPAGRGLVVVPEFRNPDGGRPDIALVRPGTLPRAFVELKAPSKPADPTRWRDHDRVQFERFRELAFWGTSNFVELRLFARSDVADVAAIVPETTLRPDRDDSRADREIVAHESAPFMRSLEMLAQASGQPPTSKDAPELATRLAHSARLVRGIVMDRLAAIRADGTQGRALLQVRQEFRDVLYAHPEAGGYSSTDFDSLFSAAFAQTLAFGLLLVREATRSEVGADAWQHMPPEHPLMRTALRVLSQPEIVQDIGLGFDVMLDTINSFALQILAPRRDGSDPILYFYEDFLATFDPEARERYGVYYTPVEVVRYMVSALDRALRVDLATEGLRDPKVTILDPATGTGTFLLGIAEKVRAEESHRAGSGMAALALRGLAQRMFGFELLVGPYAVAHYRIHHALRVGGREGESDEAATIELPRLGVYLTDTLAEPGADAPLGTLGFVSEGIREERIEANRIKAQQPILAILGNPPYRRLEEGENRTLVGNWMDDIWDDLKAPVRLAGRGGQLNTFPELSVAFWRWAMWKLFESENAPRRGVVAFITNRKFLTGWPYAGLRKMMRERFDRIEIIDLRGDIRRGWRAGVEDDEGVFNIMVGTAITLAIADGSKEPGKQADVLYVDSWTGGHFSRRAKLDWLIRCAEEGISQHATSVERDALDDLRPRPFLNGEWVNICECFNFSKSGMKSGNDPVFVSVRQAQLNERLGRIGRSKPNFHFNDRLVRYYSYRPLDRRWFYNDLALLNRPGPEMQEAWGSDNVGLYALPSGTGAGPAVWAHGLLPDYHAFRGSYGGYAFPLYDRRPGHGPINVSATLLTALSAAYGVEVGAQDAFDSILCLLSAASYTLRFAEDLEDVFPHVPFPARLEVFRETVRIGAVIRELETFARTPSGVYQRPDLARVLSEPRGALAPVTYVDGGITLCEDGSGKVTGISHEVWGFSVSGYRVIPRWLEARIGLPADFELVREFRDICGRTAELIDLFAEADTVLSATLEETLTREALGFHRTEQGLDA